MRRHLSKALLIAVLCASLAEFLQYGLLRGSFIPPRRVRQMRELTRMRVHIQQDRNRVINRIGRLLETVNIKLGSVASSIAGKSGRAILRRIAEGPQQPEELARLALGALKQKTPDLILALDGRPDPHFRWILARLLQKLEWLDAELAGVDARLCEEFLPHEDLVRRLCTIPGVDKTTARVILAELGTDMEQFPSAARAASWAGLCPGNSASAGQRFSGRTRKGDRYLRRILVQSGWAAARTRDCFLAALFHRIAHRRGFKKAVVAVAHRILTMAWSIIRNGSEYQERGGDHFDRLHPERTARKLTQRLQRIGFEVILKHPPGRPRITPPPMPPTSCTRCWHMGIVECIHLLKRRRKSKTDSGDPSDSVG